MHADLPVARITRYQPKTADVHEVKTDMRFSKTYLLI